MCSYSIGGTLADWKACIQAKEKNVVLGTSEDWKDIFELIVLVFL